MRESPAGKRALFVFLLVLIPLLVYSGNLAAGFVYDDNAQILANPWITDPSRIGEILTSSSMAFLKGKPSNTYRPLVYISYMAEYTAFGLKPALWHLVNMILHCLNAVMAFFLIRRLTEGRRAGDFSAFAAAIIFALHPVNSEAVSWVGALPELLFTFFILVSFYLYVGPMETVVKRALSVVLFFLALLTKETAMALVIFIVIYEVLVRREGLSRWWTRAAPHAGAAVVYMALRTAVIGGVAQVKAMELTIYEAIINVFPLLAKYLGKLFFPVGLSVIYSYRPAASILEPVTIIGIIVAALYLLALVLSLRRRLLAFFILWIPVPLLPVLYVPVVSAGGFADRYLYLPSIGFGAAIGLLYGRFFAESPARGKLAPLAILLALYTALSVSRSLVWRDDLSLWTDAVAKTPGSANARYNLGWSLHRKGELEKALEEYREAIRINPSKAEAHYNAALIYQQRGDLDRALRHYIAAARLKPADARPLYNAGIIYQKTGRLDLAVEMYIKALNAAPESADIHYNLAAAYQSMGDYDLALRHYRESLVLDPKGADAYYNMGVIYRKRGMREEARAEFRKALEIRPDYRPAMEALKALAGGEKG